MANGYRSRSVVGTMAQELFEDGMHVAWNVIVTAPKVVKYMGEEIFYGAITPFLFPTAMENTKAWDDTESVKYRAGAPFVVMGTIASVVGLGYLALQNPRLLVVPAITNAADFLYRRYHSTKKKLENEQ